MAKAKNMGRKKAPKNKKNENWANTVTVQRDVPLNKKYTEHQYIVNCGNVYSAQGTALVYVYKGNSFNLTQFGNYTHFTNLYDQFRIDKVEIRMYLRNPGTGVQYPRLHIYPDFDDDANPPSVADALAHPRVETHVFTPTTPEFRYAIEPRMAAQVYGPIVSSYAMAPRGMFADSANPSVKFYGYKTVIEGIPDTTQYIDFYYRFFVTCRNPL